MSPFCITTTSISSALCVVLGIFSVSEISLSMAYSPGSVHRLVGRSELPIETCSRRSFVRAGAVAFSLATAITIATPRANAFDNRLDDRYSDAIQTPGKQPKDLGYSQRSNYVGLKECGNSPNCWNSSAPKANLPARWLPAWESNGRSIEDVKRVIDTYQVGQNNVDGGGFQVVEFENNKKNNKQYLYVQFQSYKAGYIDDFECWYNPESKKFDVRSSSRVGYSDLGVNALRLEYIANRLEKEYSWTFERRKNGKLV